MSTDRIVFEGKNEHFGFTQIPNVVLTSTVLNPTEKMIYSILRRYATMSKGALPAVSTICLEANISQNTYNRAIKTFIKSVKNPKPDVPLITAIHRDGMSNVFKIHQINDPLVEKLKPVIAFSKDEKKEAKSAKKAPKKRKRKALVQKDILNNPSQNDLGTPPQNDWGGYSQNDLLVILNNSNIDNNKQDEPKDVVVVSSKTQKETAQKKKNVDANIVLLQEKFQKIFKQPLPLKTATQFVALAKELGKDIIEDCLKPTVRYLKQEMDRTGEKPKRPIGALRHGIEHGWTIHDAAPKKQVREFRNYDRIDPTTIEMERRLKMIAAEKAAANAGGDGQ